MINKLKMTTPTSNGVHIVQVRSDITTTASLKNLNSTTNIHGRFITKVPLAMGSLVDRIEILRCHDDLQPGSSQQGATNGTYRGVGDEQELTAGTFPLHDRAGATGWAGAGTETAVSYAWLPSSVLLHEKWKMLNSSFYTKQTIHPYSGMSMTGSKLKMHAAFVI